MHTKYRSYVLPTLFHIFHVAKISFLINLLYQNNIIDIMGPNVYRIK
jgi:hypothetical protein